MDQTLTVTIRRVRQIDRPDGFLGGQADYYAKVRVDGIWMKSSHDVFRGVVKDPYEGHWALA